jgi:hypothetical protein
VDFGDVDHIIKGLIAFLSVFKAKIMEEIPIALHL